MRSSQDNLTVITRYLLILILSVSALPAVSQGDEDPPDSPVFRLVTINQLTGNTEMSWSLSPSPDVAGYVVYSFLNNEGYAIDTILNPNSTFYSVFRPEASYFSEAFVIAAIDTAGNISPLSNELRTIFTRSLIDTCNKKIIISWNKYNPYPSNVTGYEVLASVNGNAYYLAEHTSSDITEFTLNDFVNGAAYCFVVRAILENNISSFSNKTSQTAIIQNPPEWINADFATVTVTGEIELEFTIDPSSEINLFGLERRTGPSGSFQQIAQIRTGNGQVTYTDKTADLGKINYYRLSAINSCAVAALYSNLASNIVLQVQSSGNEILLSWNNYHDWTGPVSGYSIFMDTGNGYSEEWQTEPGDTLFSVVISNIMYKIREGNVCFYVTATEASNPYVTPGQSSSARICYNLEEVITVPDIFTPNSDGRNDYFKPVITFSPSDYQLIISNRQGRIFFSTRDFLESWDGSVNGVPAPEGVYIWIVKLTTPTGKRISRTGTLTLFKNR